MKMLLMRVGVFRDVRGKHRDKEITSSWPDRRAFVAALVSGARENGNNIPTDERRGLERR